MAGFEAQPKRERRGVSPRNTRTISSLCIAYGNDPRNQGPRPLLLTNPIYRTLPRKGHAP